MLPRTHILCDAATSLIAGLFAISFSVTLANIASASRLTWAWARDGGLPVYFAYVDPRHRVPIRAMVLVVAIVCVFCLLKLSSSSYVAFGAIASVSILALYASNAITIASMLYARFRRTLSLGEWNIGPPGVFVNAYALVYTLWIMVFLPFPSTIPVTAATMNYCGSVFAFVVLVAVTLWFTGARTKWVGPSITIREIVLANANSP